MSKWIDFCLLPKSPDRKTDTWYVKTKDPQTTLGTVSWLGRWRQYAFFPYGNTAYERQCLRDIADFCEQQSREYRKAKQ